MELLYMPMPHWRERAALVGRNLHHHVLIEWEVLLQLQLGELERGGAGLLRRAFEHEHQRLALLHLHLARVEAVRVLPPGKSFVDLVDIEHLCRGPRRGEGLAQSEHVHLRLVERPRSAERLAPELVFELEIGQAPRRLHPRQRCAGVRARFDDARVTRQRDPGDRVETSFLRDRGLVVLDCRCRGRGAARRHEERSIARDVGVLGRQSAERAAAEQR